MAIWARAACLTVTPRRWALRESSSFPTTAPVIDAGARKVTRRRLSSTLQPAVSYGQQGGDCSRNGKKVRLTFLVEVGKRRKGQVVQETTWAFLAPTDGERSDSEQRLRTCVARGLKARTGEGSVLGASGADAVVTGADVCASEPACCARHMPLFTAKSRRRLRNNPQGGKRCGTNLFAAYGVFHTWETLGDAEDAKFRAKPGWHDRDQPKGRTRESLRPLILFLSWRGG